MKWKLNRWLGWESVSPGTCPNDLHKGVKNVLVHGGNISHWRWALGISSYSVKKVTDICYSFLKKKNPKAQLKICSDFSLWKEVCTCHKAGAFMCGFSQNCLTGGMCHDPVSAVNQRGKGFGMRRIRCHRRRETQPQRACFWFTLQNNRITSVLVMAAFEP